MLLCCFAFTAQIYAQQQIKVSGVVSDESGEPIIGASVTILNTTTGTLTDIDGKFTLNVPSNVTLKISYIGFTPQEIPVSGKTTINVVLKEDSKLLDEVVVVGYGTQRVKDLTGAATPVQMEDIENLPGSNLLDALSGQVVGLNITKSDGRPGSTSGKVTIRRPAPILSGGTGNGQPLIVIDDVIQVNYEGDPDMAAFYALDYSEIESMTVLKDASAAIYGARASNGVILIKTKRGAIGSPQISYSAKLDFSDAVSHVKMMNAYDVGILTNRMFRQTFANGGKDYTGFSYSEDELNKMKSMNYDWLGEAWDSSFSHRHSLNVSGGSEKATYFAGLSYQDQGTNLGSLQDYNKWTFRTGTEIKVASGLKISASVAGFTNEKISGNDNPGISDSSWGRRAGSDGDYVILRHMPKHIPMSVNLETEPGISKNYWISPYIGPHAVNNAANINSLSAWNYFANQESGSKKINKENGYSANFSLSYDIPFIKGLSVKGTYALNYNNTFGEEIQSYYTLARAQNTNKEGLHLIDNSTKGSLIWDLKEYRNSANPARIVYKKATSRGEQMNFMINYDRTFGEHNVSAVGVIERAESEGSDESLTYQNPWKNYNGTSITAGELLTDKSATYLKKYESGTLSYIGRVNYKYGNRYLAQFLIRSDASTKFAPENYWGTFPSGSVGWVVSEENFFKKSKVANIFDYLKLRYSLGLTGKDNVNAWSWLTYYAFENGTGFGSQGGELVSGLGPSGTANRNIRWDKTVKTNYGIDLNILDNRLALTTDYFYDKTSDLIMLPMTSSYPIYIGASVPPVNYGKSDSWGWEFTLRWNDKINQSLLPKWGPIKYGIGVDYGISWYKMVLGTDPVFNHPAVVNNNQNATGYRSPDNTYGMKVWRGTSSGDGILRTDEDVQRYWQYLKDLAVTSKNDPNAEPTYFGTGIGKDAPKNIYKGMLAYQDMAGSANAETGIIEGPNGSISSTDGEDFAKLANNRTHNINTRFSLQWGDFSWSAQLATSWGGFAAIDYGESQIIDESRMIWAQPIFANDMYDPVDNPNGKYPSMAVNNAWNVHSDFWSVSTFRCYVRNMSFAYSLPRNILKPTGIDRVQLALTGNNLWDFYNPYPKKYRNMYDSATRATYPTLRTWTLSLNLTF
ncbi:SusC/RagA family TonB-linked outer membrane protein [Dysgonomonas termitidis]|uniref:SusC/RagA family TonB-linked outer membrane protein n=1 Tax=Dysgonomonas termitidis TaxID=1516126 RepID=A0ABV9L126_9BACT